MEIHTTITVLCLCTAVLAQDGTINLGGSIMVQDPSGDPSVNPSPDTGGGGGGDGTTIEGMVLPGGSGDTSQSGTENVVDSGGAGATGDQSGGTNTVGSTGGQSAGEITGTNTEGAAAGNNQGEMGQGSTVTGGGGVSNQDPGTANIGGGVESAGPGVSKDQSNQGEVRSSGNVDTSGMTQGGGASFFGSERSVFGGGGASQDGAASIDSGASPMIAGVTSDGGNVGQNQGSSTGNTEVGNTGTPAFGGRSANSGIFDGRSGGGPGPNINANQGGRAPDDMRVNTGGDPRFGGTRNIGGSPRMGGAGNIGGDPRMGGAGNIGGDPRMGGAGNIGDGSRMGGARTSGGDPRMGGAGNIGGGSRMGSAGNIGGDPRMGGAGNIGGDPRMGGAGNIGGDPRMGGAGNIGGSSRIGGAGNIGGDPRMRGVGDIGGGGRTGTTRNIGAGGGQDMRGRIGNEGGGSTGTAGGAGMRGEMGNQGGVIRGGRGSGGGSMIDERGAAAAAAAAANVIRGASRRDNDRRVSRDRIVGGIGGGGFGDLSMDRGACNNMCGFDTETCYRRHNCTHYEHCYPFSGTICTCTLRPCSFGTLWSRESGRCETASNVFCEDDPCDKNSRMIAYPSGINCKSYYICSEEYRRRSIPMCCTDFHSYSEAEERCVPDDTCGRIPCTVQSSYYDPDMYATSTPEPIKITCPLMPHRHDPSKFMYKDFPGIVMSCAPGAVYDDSACTCDRTADIGGAPIIRGCSELLTLDFGPGSLTNPRRRVPLYAEDVKLVVTDKNAKYGVFNGVSSEIEIPYFSANPLKKLVLRIRFFTLGKSGPENQVLVSFCHTPPVNPPTRKDIPNDRDTNTALTMLLNRVDRKIIVEGYTLETQRKERLLDLDFQPGQWNSIELIFDGNVLLARNRVLTTEQPKPIEKSIQLRGFLNGGTHPLSIGSCRSNDGFHGYMDLIKIYKCIPSNPRG